MITDSNIDCFRREGMVVLPHCIAAAEMAQLRTLTASAYQFVEEVAHSLDSSVKLDDYGVRVWECNEHGWITFDDLVKFAQAKGITSSVLPGVAAKLSQAAHELAPREFHASLGPMAKLRRLMGRPPRGFVGTSKHLTDCSVVRRQSEKIKQPKVQWHRDFNAAYTEPGRFCLNFWVPLVDVGTDNPSLEFIKGSNAVLSRRPEELNYYSDDDLGRLLGRFETYVPVLQAGDVCAFDEHTVHRTQPYESKSVDRTSCEFRFIFN